jgi:hypothetical protein
MRWTTIAIACAVVLGLLALFACAPAPQPAAPPPTPAAIEPGAGSASAVGAPAQPNPEPAVSPVSQARKLDLTNTCPRAIHLYYGASPSDTRGQSATVAGGATVDVPRGADGTTTVWIVDDAGRGLASVSVRRRMTHVQIDPGCGRIDAF